MMPTPGSPSDAHCLTIGRLVAVAVLLVVAGCGGGAAPAAPAVSLGAEPAAVSLGERTTLAWQATDATECTASGSWTGARPTSGTEATAPLAAPASYTLACTGPGGTETATTAVAIAPPVVSIAASPATVTAGQAATLTWSASGATDCTASGGWSGPRTVNGSQSTGALSTTTNYSLTCASPGGTRTVSATVTVTPPPAAPAVVLTANPSSLAAGAAALLTWSSSNASACTASGGWSGSRATSGTQSTGAVPATTTYTLTCTGAGGASAGSTTVTVVPAATGRYPLRTEPGQRHLIDAQGAPFLMQGDAAWSLIVGLTREEAETYLEDRRQKGYNTVLVNLIESAFAADPPRNRYGDAPFLVAGDYSTPNEAYFAHADFVIGLAASKGMLVVLTPSYAGFGGGEQGWYSAMVANGATRLQEYGQYVANRFRDRDNILWLQGGDYDVPSKALPRAIANGIRAVDTRWPQSYHGSRGTAALEFYGTGEPWLTVNNIYTTHTTVVAEAQVEYERSPVPAFLLEARYESPTYSPLIMRTQAWQAVLSGMSGHIAGEERLWQFDTDWQASLDSPAASQYVHLRTLLEARVWERLVPDFAGSFLTSDPGTGVTRAVAARDASGLFAVAYLPTSRTIDVDLGQLAGFAVTARWYDPTSGSFTAIGGSPFPASGSRSFAAPAANAAGSSDWVLLLESAAP